MFLSLIDLLNQSGWPAFSQTDEHRIDIADEGAELVVRAQLAGIDPKSVQVHLSESALAIAGRGTREERVEAEHFQRWQMSASSFYKVLPLAARINPRLARMEWPADGQLVLRLPKA